MGKRPTIQMVADLAGVSRGTVDRVLNNRSYVSAPVRQRVLAAIAETGYVSHREHYQQTLRSAAAQLTLGVLLPNWGDQFRAEVEQGIRMAREELEDAAVRVVVRRCSTDLPQEALDLLEDESFQQMRQEILEKLMALPQAKKGEVFLWAKDLEKYKDDLRFLDMMQLWYRDLLYAKRLRSEKDLIQKDKKAEIFRSAVESEGELARKAALIQRARVQLARNANFRLTMEVMLLQLKEN